MASWNQPSAGTNYWSEQTQLTKVGYGCPPSPPRSPSPAHTMSYEQNHHGGHGGGGGYGSHGGGGGYGSHGGGGGYGGHEDHSYSSNMSHNHGMTALTHGQVDHHSYNQKPQHHHGMGGMGGGGGGHQGLFGELLPTSFPPGTDPKVVQTFKNVDRDGSGFIDEKELKNALSSYSSTFSLRTIRLMMYAFARTNTKAVGPKEFIAIYAGLQQWKAMFHQFDRDRNGKIDMSELREALRGLGYPVSETVLNIVVMKFDKTSGNRMVIGFDGFIECCLTVKGLSDKFKERDQMGNGTATFSFEAFMMAVLPFIVA